MKPKVYWYPEGSCYICEVSESYFEPEVFTHEDYQIYYSCGAGRTMREAYDSWLADAVEGLCSIEGYLENFAKDVSQLIHENNLESCKWSSEM